MSELDVIMGQPLKAIDELVMEARAIDERLKQVENMPRVETVPSWFYDEEPEHGICPNCAGNGCSTCNYIGEI